MSDNIILYSTHCPKCNVLEKKLKEKGVQYTEVNDVDKMLAMGFTEVPVLSVSGNNYKFSEALRWITLQ